MKTNTTQRTPPAGKPRSAMTLIEVMMALGLGSMLLGATASLSLFTARSFTALGNYDDLDRYSRNALDVMSRDIRQTRALAAYQPNLLVFQDNDGATNLTYSWNPSTEVLTRRKAAVTTVMLTNCSSLVFNIFQRNPSNAFNFYPATNNMTGVADPSMCKLISVTWKCGRQILGRTANTETVQTAKIVMRD
jgi:hypothetical protein